MSRIFTAALLGTLFVACDSADSPVAPVPTGDASIDAVAGSAGGATYTANATAVDATDIERGKMCATGPLPKDGGRIEDNVVNASLAGVLSASRLYCITGSMDNNRVASEATVWGLSLTIDGNTITADELHSMAGGRCPPSSPGPAHTGHAFVKVLKINGRLISVRANTPNQKFEIRNGFIVFNDQTSFVTRWHAGRTVIGLRVVITNPVRKEILLSRTQTHIDCP